MRKYIYIDESGDLGIKENSSKYLTISALITDSPEILDKIIKKMRRGKFKKELSKANEIKANKSSEEVIFHMLKKINEHLLNCEIYHVIFNKKKLYSEFLIKDKNKLYNYVAGFLAKKIILDSRSVEIRIDKSKRKQLLRDDFNYYFAQKLKEGCNNLKCDIFHSYSHSFSGLQFADIISWSCFQKFERNNSEFLEKLKVEQYFHEVWTKTEPNDTLI